VASMTVPAMSHGLTSERARSCVNEKVPIF
jgi:hypothetical protein